jgi:hypothetical protein
LVSRGIVRVVQYYIVGIAELRSEIDITTALDFSTFHLPAVRDECEQLSTAAKPD